MKLLVIAGGLGTRLQSALDGTPKALAPVNCRPFLSIQIEHWIDQNIRSFVFLLHHQANLIVEFLHREKNGLLKNCTVEILIEPTLLGTGGAVAYAVDQLKLKNEFLVINADTWIGHGICQLLQTASPSMLLINVENHKRYGNVIFNKNKIITSFLEKSNLVGGGWINSGLCLMNAKIFAGWDKRPFSLERETFPMLARQGDFKAVCVDTDFIDIGIPEDYLRFCNQVKLGIIGGTWVG